MAKKIDFAAIGAKGGASRSPAKLEAAKKNVRLATLKHTAAKAKASRKNGKQGGRPAAIAGVVSKTALYKRAQRKRDKLRLKSASK